MILGRVLSLFDDNGHGLPRTHHNKVKSLMQAAYDLGASDKAAAIQKQWQVLLEEIDIAQERGGK